MLCPYYMRAYLLPLPPFPSVEYRLPHELIDYPNGASSRYCRDALTFFISARLAVSIHYPWHL